MTRTSLDGEEPSASRLVWRTRATARILGICASTTWRFGALCVFVLLAASWLLARSVGGAGIVPPHWFYLPIIFAAVRFGPVGALLTSVASTVLAGPLLPLTLDPPTAQAFSDWSVRGAFFVGIGLFLAVVLHDGLPARIAALQTVRTDRTLRRALADDELEVYYQPIFEIRGRRRRMVGAEALLRWHHPSRGMVGPSEFIEVAEQTGLIHELGDMVFTAACRQIGAWTEHLGRRSFLVSVNLSARQLADPALVERVTRILDESEVDAERLCLEITETAFIDEPETSLAQLNRLRDLGFSLAVDDFGTGYSSLSYVHRFPIRTIKIDRSFIEHIVTDDTAASIVSTTIDLTHMLGYRALAEGVETAEQLAILRVMGCDLAQGFHLARPAPAAMLTDTLRAHRPPQRTARGERTRRGASEVAGSTRET